MVCLDACKRIKCERKTQAMVLRLGGRLKSEGEKERRPPFGTRRMTEAENRNLFGTYESPVVILQTKRIQGRDGCYVDWYVSKGTGCGRYVNAGPFGMVIYTVVPGES